MSHLSALKQKIERLGISADGSTPSPVVSLEDFFEGNDDLGSIGCNLGEDEHPGINGFYRVLRDIRARADVQDVLVEIHELMEGEDEWPFAERVYILTSATEDTVRSLLEPLLADDVELGWSNSEPPGAPTLKPGMRVLAAWWD